MVLLIIILVLLAGFIYLSIREPEIALISVLPISGILFFASMSEDRLDGMILSPLIFFISLLLIANDRSDPDNDRWTTIWAQRILLTILLLGIFAGTMALGLVSFYFTVFGIVLIGSIISFGLTSRIVLAWHVISTIGAAMRQNLPLPMALQTAATGDRSERGRTLRRIAKWLTEGYSLSEAMKRGFGKCPGDILAMIATAEKTNQLAEATRSIEADLLARADYARRLRPVHPIYPVLVMTILFFILSGLMYFVIPKYEEVLKDTGLTQLPYATRLVANIMRTVWNSYAGVIVLLAMLIFIPMGLRIRNRPRRIEEPYVLSQVGDFIKWHLPLVRWFEFNYSMLHVVEALRLSLNAGYTINGAIGNALAVDANACVSKRVARWQAAVERGEDVSRAARASGLGNTLAWAFEEGPRQGNTLKVLEMLETFYRTNYSYRVNLARFIMWPCVVLCMGLTVGFVVYSIFIPIVVMTEHLMRFIVP